MGSMFFVEPNRESGPVHCLTMSHTETRRKPNERTSRGASLLSSQRPLHTGFYPRVLSSLFFVLAFWSSIIGSASATDGDRPTLLAIQLEDDLAWKGSALYIDHQPPPLMPPLHHNEGPLSTAYDQLAERAVSTDPSAKKSDFTIPQPFDTGLSNNFTTSCASFLSRLRTSDEFKTCHPFSLMLQTSSGFFDASRSKVRITQTLEATCGANATQCNNFMQSAARELVTASACKTDLGNDTPLIIQALNGLVAYPVAYAASCLKDRKDKEGSYCFANAVTNTTSTTDSYPYYLPVGQELPAGSRPTCNSCLQDAMAIYAQYGNNVTQPISKTYVSAAQQLSIACGRTFVNVTAAPLRGAATTTHTSQFTPTITLILMFVFYFFQ
ncbi:hypothetical protein CC86DRAFT_457904 [Ophiobolus disseminans]|uniref:DUF7729 domain-containing protein n=1 Tax=Ophiobolus disseminans TaxID=1469910 RepID=A0A6A6ZS15_9PLEO|nr:hypothetical protein CC86DRAFT_457904 [Ophiobolus disseminans]